MAATSAGRRRHREGSPPSVTIRPSLLSELTVAHHCVSLGRRTRGPRCLSQGELMPCCRRLTKFGPLAALFSGSPGYL